MVLKVLWQDFPPNKLDLWLFWSNLIDTLSNFLKPLNASHEYMKLYAMREKYSAAPQKTNKNINIVLDPNLVHASSPAPRPPTPWSSRMEVDLACQRLFYRGKQLENGNSLFDYSINVNEVSGNKTNSNKDLQKGCSNKPKFAPNSELFPYVYNLIFVANFAWKRAHFTVFGGQHREAYLADNTLVDLSFHFHVLNSLKPALVNQ